MQARRARVRQIRRTVTAAAVAVFIALFATIYIQMAAGKDPALGASTTTTAQVSETSTPSATSTPSSSSSSDNSSSSPVTTSQS
jgi:hypothetical protein